MKHDYDVLIIGSGWSGTALASILARHGGRVCIIEATSHPRFAIGESTIPQTSQMVSLVARQYDVPELEYLGLSTPKMLRKHISSACGIKRTFGFAYHHLGEEHDPRNAHQFGNVFRDENHLFRQDVDAYLTQVAVRYGSDLLLNTRIQEFEIDEQGVTVTTSTGKTITAHYLVDGAGFRSPVADRYNLREDPPRFAHHSRSIFTHMIDVTPFEEVVTNHLSVPWSQGTLHHCFDGGWLWVIPFNNHESSTNQLVSVGLTLDPRRWPKSRDVSPEEEFRCFIESMLPSAARQFTRAKAVQTWVSTERLQFSSSRSLGTRFCLMSHASGFLDALYSRGLINSIEIVRALAGPLLAAINDGDWSDERFAHLEEKHRKILDFADRIVNASFISWRDFRVWDWMVRVWAVAVGVTESNLGSYLLMGDHANFQRAADPIFSEFEHAGFRAFFEACEPNVLQFERGELSAEQAASNLQREFAQYEFRMRLPDNSNCVEWALRNPLTRDWYIGSETCRSRWDRMESDPHLIQPRQEVASGSCSNASIATD